MDSLPSWVGLLDLDGDGSIVAQSGPLGSRFDQATVLIRMHHAPLGVIRVPTRPTESLSLRAKAEAETALADDIRLHLERDASSNDPTGMTEWLAQISCPLRLHVDDFAGLTIAVCTRNRSARLRECLRSLRAVSLDPIEILVVDNAPNQDETRQLVAELAESDPRLRYTCEPRPGLSVARNHALAHAAYEFVAFTDDDVSVDLGWATALAAGFALDPEAVCVTGLVASATLDTPAQRYFDARVPWGEAFEPRRYDLASHRSSHPLYPFNAGMFGTGANFAVRAEAVTSIGGFDPLLGVGSSGRGGEDLDIFLRLVLAGGRISYVPSALVWHHNRRESRALRRQMYDYGHGLGAYLAKHLTNRELRRALSMYGFAHAVSILRRMTGASRQTEFGLAGVQMALSEAGGLGIGAVRYWWDAAREYITADEMP